MSSPITLYHQVGVLLRQRISDGTYREGDRLPAEKQLAAELDVSRATLRQALGELSEAGLIRREQGRGTFVAASAEQVGQRFHGSLAQLLAETERAGVAEVEIARGVELPRGVVERLGLDQGEGTIVRRVRTIDGGPFAYTVNYLPAAIGGLVDEQALRAHGLMGLLQSRGARIVSATQAITAEPADLPVSRGLAIDLGAPVLAVERILHGPDGPIQLVRSWYRSDRYVYTVSFDRAEADSNLEQRLA
jgi:GntR family transcriptional regulator